MYCIVSGSDKTYWYHIGLAIQYTEKKTVCWPADTTLIHQVLRIIGGIKLQYNADVLYWPPDMIHLLE
jgi:hypothetical protein